MERQIPEAIEVETSLGTVFLTVNRATQAHVATYGPRETRLTYRGHAYTLRGNLDFSAGRWDFRNRMTYLYVGEGTREPSVHVRDSILTRVETEIDQYLSDHPEIVRAAERLDIGNDLEEAVRRRDVANETLRLANEEIANLQRRLTDLQD